MAHADAHDISPRCRRLPALAENGESQLSATAGEPLKTAAAKPVLEPSKGARLGARGAATEWIRV
jgi:hypothetical protein